MVDPPQDPRLFAACGVTALVVHEHLGARLVLAGVDRGGERVGAHFWNELPDRTQVDLTRDQFDPEETVGEGRFVERTPGTPLPGAARPAGRPRGSGAGQLQHQAVGPVLGVAAGEPFST